MSKAVNVEQQSAGSYFLNSWTFFLMQVLDLMCMIDNNLTEI
jgi:hypothetical protein